MVIGWWRGTTSDPTELRPEHRIGSLKRLADKSQSDKSEDAVSVVYGTLDSESPLRSRHYC